MSEGGQAHALSLKTTGFYLQLLTLRASHNIESFQLGGNTTLSNFYIACRGCHFSETVAVKS